MLVTRISPVTREENTLDLPITAAQVEAYNKGAHIQHAFPGLDAALREFIISGITPEEWAKLFPPEEEEDEGQEAFAF